MPLICECDSEACAELVRVSLVDHARARASGSYIVVVGHRFDGVAEEPAPKDYMLYRPAT